MEKKIEDFIHFYVGSNILHKNGTTARIIYSGEIVGFINNDNGQFGDCKAQQIDPLLLRPLSSITDEEWFSMPDRSAYRPGFIDKYTPEHTRWLLSRSFDLFGLIEAGLAIDSTKQQL